MSRANVLQHVYSFLNPWTSYCTDVAMMPSSGGTACYMTDAVQRVIPDHRKTL